jgi:hypothetical protein
MTSSAQTVNPNHQSSNSSLVEAHLSSVEVDGPKIITEAAPEKNNITDYGTWLVEEVLLKYPDFAKRYALPIQAWSKQHPTKPHPILFVQDPETMKQTPIWMNRKFRRNNE